MPPPRLAERLASGFRLHQAGRLAEAAEQARKLLKQAPELAGAHYLAGLVALDRGKPAEAAKHLAAARRLGPESAALHQALGVAELRGGRTREAVASLEQAARLAPDHAPTLLLLAEAHRAAANETAALATLDRILAFDPAHAASLDLRGTILHRQGRLDEAVACFERALAARPGWVAALSNLAGCLIDSGSPERAVPLLRQALEQLPDHRAAARNLGLALEATGAVDEASDLFAALARSGTGEGLLELGQLELRRGRAADAVAAFRRAVDQDPQSLRAQYGLAEALRAAGETAEAADHYRACLALDPGDAVGAGLALALISGETPAALAPDFVRALFDSYAGRFDRSLTETLAYRAPALLRAALDPLLAAQPSLIMLDLGCGTGLGGAAFADRAAAIDGIDLSPRMIDQARARGLYRTLVTDDLLPGLATLPREQYDLVLAADVLVYLGDLAPLFAALALVLKPGGLFAFTVEHLPNDRGPYALQPSRRYAHAARYIESLCQAGFTLPHLDEVSTRTDRGLPVPGLLAIMRRTAEVEA